LLFPVHNLDSAPAPKNYQEQIELQQVPDNPTPSGSFPYHIVMALGFPWTATLALDQSCHQVGKTCGLTGWKTVLKWRVNINLKTL
jgi:hypothetical protein